MAKLDVARMSIAARESLLARELPGEVDRERMADYLGGLCAAIGGALARWQSQAILRDVRVEGARASGGRVVGPEVEGLIRGSLSEQIELEAGYRYTDLSDSDIDNRDAIIGLAYLFNDQLTLRVRGVVFDDDTGIELGVRFNFASLLGRDYLF